MDEESRRTYLDDFRRAIREVDDEVFLSRGKHSSSIVLLPDRPEQCLGYLMQHLAGYYPKFPSGFVEDVGPNGERRNTYISAYAIFEPLVLRYIENKLERYTIDGAGDHDIKKLWYMCAIGLVRYRVLASMQLFPSGCIQLRTQKSMVRYRHLFTESGNDFEALKDIARQLAKPLPGLDQSNVRSVDAFWTMQIVTRIRDSGATFREAMAYIVTD